MASESLPQTERKKIEIAKGKPWSRLVDAELIRLREGNVDETGTRVIRMTKNELAQDDRSEIMRRKAQGYEVAEEKYEYVFTMPQQKWKDTVEKRQHEEGLRRMKATQKLDDQESRDLLPEYSRLTISPDPISANEVASSFFDD